jgi:hypothetical protein
MEETTPSSQNAQSNINTINNTNRINIMNIPRGSNITRRINITSTNITSTQSNNNNSSSNNNNNATQDEYGMDGTLLFLPSTVHCQQLNRNNAIPSMLNSFGGIISNITIPVIENIFSSNNSNNNILSFLNNHTNDFQFNNLVNIIMSFESSMHGNPPASQRAMDSLPKVEVTNDNINKFKDITCNICLEGFQLGNILRVLECNHEFHENCIITWLKSRNTCPVCRHELESNDPNYERRKNNHRENLRNIHRNNNNGNNNNNSGGGNSGMFI